MWIFKINVKKLTQAGFASERCLLVKRFWFNLKRNSTCYRAKNKPTNQPKQQQKTQEQQQQQQGGKEDKKDFSKLFGNYWYF